MGYVRSLGALNVRAGLKARPILPVSARTIAPVKSLARKEAQGADVSRLLVATSLPSRGFSPLSAKVASVPSRQATKAILKQVTPPTTSIALAPPPPTQEPEMAILTTEATEFSADAAPVTAPKYLVGPKVGLAVDLSKSISKSGAELVLADKGDIQKKIVVKNGTQKKSVIQLKDKEPVRGSTTSEPGAQIETGAETNFNFDPSLFFPESLIPSKKGKGALVPVIIGGGLLAAFVLWKIVRKK